MRLGCPETESRLREAALKRIRRSPRLREQYDGGRKRVGRFRSALGCLFSALLLIALLPIALAAAFVPWLAPAVVLGWIAGQGGAAMDSVLGFVSLAGSVIAYLVGFGLVSGLRRSHELAILAHLPISDQDIVRVFQRDALSPGVLLLLPCVLFYATFALRRGLPGASALGTVALGSLELGCVLALAALFAGLLPRRLAMIGFLGVIVAASTGLAALVMDLLNLAAPIPWPGLAQAAKLLLPTGWVNAAVQYGLVEGETAAWLMLVPVGLLLLSMPAALERLRSAYHVRELRLVDRETAEAVFEDESLWRGWFRQRVLGESGRPAAVPESHQGEAFDAEAARQRVLSREFLDGWNWQEQGFVERTAASLLTRRQRDIVEFLLAKPPEWTRVLTVVVLAGLFPVLAIEFLLAPPALFSCVLSAMLVLGGALVVTSRTTWTSADRMCSPAFAHVPIGYGEIMRAVMIAGTVRALMLLPVVILAGASFFLSRGLDPLEGAMVGVRSTLIAVAIHYWSFLIFRQNVTSHGPVLTNLVQIVAYPLLVVSFGVSAVALVFPGVTEPWNTLAAGGMFGSGWLVCRYDKWRFNRGTYDLIARPGSEDESA